MMTRPLLAILVSGLAGCAAAPTPPPGLPAAPAYRAVGSDWTLTVGRRMVFTSRSGVRVVQPTPAPIHGFAGEIYRTPRIDLNIVHARCPDPAGGPDYPDRVQLGVDGRRFDGCGGR